jgi:hypothetical protein
LDTAEFQRRVEVHANPLAFIAAPRGTSRLSISHAELRKVGELNGDDSVGGSLHTEASTQLRGTEKFLEN